MITKLKQGILISFISFAAGAVVTYFVADYIQLKSNASLTKASLNPISKSDITKPKNQHKPKSNDPFDQMDKVHDRMKKRMDKFFGSSFGNSLFDVDPFSGSSFTTNNIKINRYEDDGHKYIELSGDGVNEDSLQVNIAGGMISIAGEIKQSEENNNAGSHSSSSYISKFNQSFSVPHGVEEASVKIESEENKLIIKFPKERI